MLVAIFVFSIVSIPIGYVRADGEAQLYINPPVVNEAPENVGTDFTVSVTLSNFVNLMGFDLQLTWNNSLITLVSVDKTPLNTLWPTWTIVYEVPSAGSYELAATSISIPANNTGASVLFNLTFQVATSSTSPVQTPIHFAVVKLSDNATPIPNPIPATVTDGLYTMSAAETVWFNEVGVGSDFSGTVLTVDGNGYGVSALPVMFTWDVGSNHTFAYGSPLVTSTGTTQYVWTSTTGLATSQNGTINVSSAGGLVTANYETQYWLAVVSPYDTPGGMGWYDSGSTANATLTNATVNITPGSVQAVFTGWSGDATGTSLTSNPITMSGPMTAIANWMIQYNLTVVTNPSGLPPIPGANWYDNGTWVELTAPQYVPNSTGVNGVRYNFSYWDVDGVSQGIGVNPIDVQMNEAHVATAHFTVQCLVTFGQTGLDTTATSTVVTVNGSAIAYGSLPFSEWVDNGTTVSYLYSGIVSSSVSGEQFSLSNVTGQASPVTVTGPMDITGNYVVQYNISFSLTGVGNDFTGNSTIIDNIYNVLPASFWWNNGSTHSFAFLSPLVGQVEPYFWNSTTGLSPLQNGSIVITGPGNLIGNYVNNVHSVIVVSITFYPYNVPMVYQGCYNLTILVTIKNTGDYPESTYGGLWYNYTAGEIIGPFPAKELPVGQSATYALSWDTTYVPIYYNYTLTAIVSYYINDSSTMNVPNFQVRIPGDVNGDTVVNMRDIALVARAFGSNKTSSNWNLYADINGDGVVNMRDVALAARHFGQQVEIAL